MKDKNNKRRYNISDFIEINEAKNNQKKPPNLEAYKAEIIAQNEELCDKQVTLDNLNIELFMLFDSSPIPLLVINQFLEVIKYNQIADEVFGFGQKQFMIQSLFSFIRFKDSRTDIVTWLNNKSFQKEALEISIELNGILKYFRVYAKKYEYNNELTLLSFVDVTDLKEQKLEFETIFKSSKDGIAIVDLETNFLEFNEAYLMMTGFNREELLTKSCVGLTVTEDRQKSIDVKEQILTQGFINNFEKTCLTKDNKRVMVNMSIALLPDKQRLLIVAKDVSMLKTIESQLRLASMGEMIGNIAHQWRQPLSVITTLASGLKVKIILEESLDDEHVEFAVDNIIAQANYLSKTIDDFRDFIKNDSEQTQISIKETIQDAIHLSKAMMKDNFITLVTHLDDDMMILGKKNELIQAIINILNNAKDALIQNIADTNDRIISISSQTTSNKQLKLKIQDSGGGISADIIERIFEPYFTTKHKSQGTGLGLSMSHKIITERHQQTLNVHNETFEYNGKTYRGACFKIVFKEYK